MTVKTIGIISSSQSNCEKERFRGRTRFIADGFSFRVALIVLFHLSVMLGVSSPVKGQGIERQIISVTDIHFNPFSNPSLAKELAALPYQKWDAVFAKSKAKTPATYDEETNPVLFQRLIKAMKRKSNGVSAVIFAGDIMAHHFNEMIAKYTNAADNYVRNRLIYKTVGYVTLKLKGAFPGAPIYFSLGNNDAYNGDYGLVDDGEFLHTTADLFFENFIKQKRSRNNFYSTFPLHGYYSVPFPAVHRGRIIGLNTIFFSAKFSPAAGSDPGKAELDWLEKALIKAQKAKERVWLLLHITPGVNVYGTQHDSTGKSINVKLLWQPKYNQRYLELVRKYHDVIVSSFAGHTHMDDFRLIYNSDKSKKPAVEYIHITASVSPVFGNNPAFQVLSYNPQTGVLKDATTYYMDLTKERPVFEKEYRYVETYDADPDLSGLDELYPSLLKDSNKRKSYIDYYPVNSTKSSISDVWQWYWCGIGNLTPSAYKACKQKR